MSLVHWHLILVHLPILFIPLALLILLLGAWLKNEGYKALAMALFLATAMISVPAFLTGESAEEAVEDLPLVSNSIIEAHEEAAEFAFYVTLLTGALACLGLVLRKNPRFQRVSMAGLVFTGVVSSVSLGRAGYLGGQIRHSEIRDGNAIEKAPEKHEDEKE